MSHSFINNSDLENAYFDWLCQIVTSDNCVSRGIYRKLLTELHTVNFTYTVLMDRNRAADGLALRTRFGLDITHRDIQGANEIARHITGECSVLEMMIALVLRCEETIMDDTRFGNRTEYWFWRMINTMHLTEFTDSNFDRQLVAERIRCMLDREYSPDGDGGLFFIPGIREDLRDVEIWTQMLWYLDTLT